MDELLKKEFAQLDRQYSYESTVQLGRYRLDSSEEEKRRVKECPKTEPEDEFDRDDDGKLTTAHHPRPSPSHKKSVRFHEHDHHTEYSSEDRSTWSMRHRIKCWLAQCREVFSWKSIRLMLIDWLFLAILGIGMALTSMFMDNVIEYMQTFQLYLMYRSGHTGSVPLDYLCTYLSWLGYTELLVICSATFVHYVAPQAIGSGVPEMKTILRGVVLKDYLTLRTLISKVVGLTFSLGSGIPIGKMGPFVHVAANAANLLSNLAAQFEGAYGNECRKSEMLAAACATGVACTFSAPIGGVLLSIELTTMYFSVRNYWRGFFAAACGATVFRLLRVVAFETEVTLVAFYQTQFPQDAFMPAELPFFALIGLLCGFIGAGFIVFYRSVVIFLRQNACAKRLFQKNWLVYPVVVAFLVATVTYPRGYGRFLSGRYKFTRTVLDFFSNCTWSKPVHSEDSPHGCSSDLMMTWTNHEGYGPYNVFLVLCLFTFTFLILAALCNTMPIPCGMFMPLFVVGAAFGRLIGEIVASIFPEGLHGGTDHPIFPGIYAVVGAAAMTGAITHSVSVAMICCEITGQLIYIIPLMIAVIIANAVCAYFQPSIYDVVIGIKHLPYLPDIPPSNADVHLCTAEHIMVANVRYLCRVTQYKEMRNMLVEMPKLRSFPVVDDPSSMMLLGSISRRTLLELLSNHIGDEARKDEAERRIRLAIETIDKHFREAQLDLRSVSSGRTDTSPGGEAGVREAEQSVTVGIKETKSDHEQLRYEESRPRSHKPELLTMNRAFSESFLDSGSMRKWSDEESPPTTNFIDDRHSHTIHHFDHNHFPAVDLSDHPIQIDVPPRNAKRFVVEPVSEKAARKQSRKFSGMKRKVHSIAHPPTFAHVQQGRMRRNAFSSSSVAMQGKLNDDDNIESVKDRDSLEQREQNMAMTGSRCRNDSSASTPSQKKLSGPESLKSGNNPNWQQQLAYDHQNSLSRNIAEYVVSAKKRLKLIRSKHSKAFERVEYDLFDDERRQWEQDRLEDVLEIDDKYIDPAPFQLVRRTSVYKVHSLFSLLELNRAYVTDRGRLVGVVALRDLRIAIQNAQNGIPLRQEPTENFDSMGRSSTMVGNNNSDSSLPTDLDLENGRPNGVAFLTSSTGPVGLNILTLEEQTQKILTPQTPPQQISPMSFFDNLDLEDQRVVEAAAQDKLTPTLKVVHASSASLHNYNLFTNQLLSMIQEENENLVAISRKSSLKSSRNSSLKRHHLQPPQDSKNVAAMVADTNRSREPSLSLSIEPEVAQAVAYLRRKSIAIDELECHDETCRPI